MKELLISKNEYVEVVLELADIIKDDEDEIVCNKIDKIANVLDKKLCLDDELNIDSFTISVLYVSDEKLNKKPYKEYIEDEYDLAVKYANLSSRIDKLHEKIAK